MVSERFGHVKWLKINFLTKNLKNHLYNHHHLIWFERPLDPQYTLKNSENKPPTPIIHVESIFDGFRTIGTRKIGYISLWWRKISKIASTTITTWFERPLGPRYMLKNSENKALTPIFDVESIFDGYRRIGTRKIG